MKRRLITLCSALSMLLCAAVSILWVRSYWSNDRLGWRWGAVLAAVSSGNAAVGFHWTGAGDVLGPFVPAWTGRRSAPVTRPAGVADHLAFRVRTVPLRVPRATGGGVSVYTLVVPHWFLVVLFAALPAVRCLRRVRAVRRGRAGTCAACGYDLRATPDRCPECGAAAVRKTA